MKKRNGNCHWVPWMVLGCMFMVGCGPSGPRVVPVSGQVTYKGKPVTRITLGFTPEGGSGRPSTGETDAQGKFELVYEGTRKGAEVGKHSVSFNYQASDPGEEMEILEGKKKRPPEIEALFKKYGPNQPPLIIEIKEPTKGLELKID